MAVRDKRSGASIVAERLWGKLLTLDRHDARLKVAIAAVAAHPELTSLYSVLDCAVALATNDLARPDGKDMVRRARALTSASTQKAVERCAEMLLNSNGSQFCVLSHSGTVDRVFERIAREGNRTNVLCAESRPLLEGRATAKTLAAMGHRVVLCSDAQIVGMMMKDSVVVLGCDRLGVDRFRNKVGSLPLALGSRHHGSFSVLVSGSDKLVDSRIPWVEPRQEGSAELWKGSHHGVVVDNRYFEDVPLSLIDSAVIGDRCIVGTAGTAELKPPSFHEKTVQIVSACLAGEIADTSRYARSVLDESRSGI